MGAPKPVTAQVEFSEQFFTRPEAELFCTLGLMTTRTKEKGKETIGPHAGVRASGSGGALERRGGGWGRFSTWLGV